MESLCSHSFFVSLKKTRWWFWSRLSRRCCRPAPPSMIIFLITSLECHSFFYPKPSVCLLSPCPTRHALHSSLIYNVTRHLSDSVVWNIKRCQCQKSLSSQLCTKGDDTSRKQRVSEEGLSHGCSFSSLQWVFSKNSTQTLEKESSNRGGAHCY